MEKEILTKRHTRNKTKRFLVFLLLFVACSSSVFAQSKTISGVVTSAGEPLIGASIAEKGTTNGTVTDMDGKFSINVSSDNAILVVSYIGYVDQQFTVKNQKKWDIVLKEDLQSLDEVVVVGYGTQRKGNIATAVTTVKAETLQNRPVQTVGEALQGQVPGLMVTGKGAPGEAPTLQIR